MLRTAGRPSAGVLSKDTQPVGRGRHSWSWSNESHRSFARCPVPMRKPSGSAKRPTALSRVSASVLCRALQLHGEPHGLALSRQATLQEHSGLWPPLPSQASQPQGPR